MQLPLRGIIPPLVTPLTPDTRLDAPGLERVIEHVLTGGVHALFILGTTGEATSLPQPVRRDLIRATVERVNRRVPVLVGVTDTVQQQGVELARFAADHGADAVVVSTPYYTVPSQPELIAYVNAFLTAQPLPVILYSIPSLTKSSFSPATVRQLAQNPRIIGIKDSSGDLPYFESMRSATTRPDFTFLVGHEPLIADGMARGAHGSIPTGANLNPALFVQLHNALISKSPDAPALLARVNALRNFYAHTPGAAPLIRTIKGALATMGICGPHLAPPFETADPAQLQDIRTKLKQLAL